MELKVIQDGKDTQSPWYADGLNFTCSQCGNCCTGGPGYVWISKEEIGRVAEYLKITPEQMVERYCRKFDGRFSLKERRTPEGLYDCIFLKEQPAPASSKTLPAGKSAPVRAKACSIYSVRPLQCRTWPFWPELLKAPERWEHAAQRCHGMNQGSRKFTLEQIEAIRDAKDWPQNPPTSKAGAIAK